MSGTSYRVDETYIKVGKTCKYLYRAVDKEGQTIEFMRERETQRFRSETVLQEDDEGGASPPSILDQRR
jgi:transposase-like protein